MWIFLRNSFLSVVEPKPEDLRRFNVRGKDMLVVRARRRADIQRVFPRANIHYSRDRDYGFRAFVNREAVANAMHEQVMDIFYTNFKGAVAEKDRHDAYMSVWSSMLDLQYGKAKRRFSYYQQELDAPELKSVDFKPWALPDL